jgi:hypothetical protein
VDREEISVQKNRFWAHFGHSRMRPSGNPPRRSIPSSGIIGMNKRSVVTASGHIVAGKMV